MQESNSVRKMLVVYNKIIYLRLQDLLRWYYSCSPHHKTNRYIDNKKKTSIFISQAVILLKRDNQDKALIYTHAYIHIHSFHLDSRLLEMKRSASCPTQHVRSVTQVEMRVCVCVYK